MSSGGRGRDARETRERARRYQARQTFHSAQERRRTRDNLIAGIAGGLLIVGIVLVQTLYFTSGPGAPQPAPSPTSTQSPAPVESPAPTEAPTPTDSPEPSPEPSPTSTS